MTDLYWVPLSFPWRFKVVGSCILKKKLTKSSYLTFSESYSKCKTSACPVSYYYQSRNSVEYRTGLSRANIFVAWGFAISSHVANS